MEKRLFWYKYLWKYMRRRKCMRDEKEWSRPLIPTDWKGILNNNITWFQNISSGDIICEKVLTLTTFCPFSEGCGWKRSIATVHVLSAERPLFYLLITSHDICCDRRGQSRLHPGGALFSDLGKLCWSDSQSVPWSTLASQCGQQVTWSLS